MPNFAISNIFQTHPSTDFLYVNLAFFIVVCTFLASFVVALVRKKIIKDNCLKKSLRSLPNFLRWNALIMLIMTLSRIEGIPYLAMRVWWIVVFLVFCFFIFKVIKKYFICKNKVQRYQKDNLVNKNINKYLPKKKKK